MLRYQNNTFRILGLLPNVSIEQAIQRANEIKVKKSLGLEISYEYDFPWMGPLDRNEENILNVMQRLEDPVSRLKEEITWFSVDTDKDKEAIQYLVQNKRKTADNIWKECSDKSITALKNRFVLAHSSTIAKEVGFTYEERLSTQKIIINEESENLYCPLCSKVYEKEWKMCINCGISLIESKKKKISTSSQNTESFLSDNHWKNWQFSINKLLLLQSSEEFWQCVNERAGQINDIRLNPKKVCDIRDQLLNDILKINFGFIAKAFGVKDYDRVKRHSNLLNGSAIPLEILRQGFNHVLGYHISLLNKCSANISKRIASLEKESDRETVMQLYSDFYTEIKDVIYEADLVDINYISDYGLAKDNVSNILRNLSIEVNNRFHDYNTAHKIINEAIETAASPYVRQNYEKDEEIIRGNLSFKTITEDDNKKHKPQISITKSLSALFGSPLSLRSWENMFSSIFNFVVVHKIGVFWAGVISFIIIYSNLSDNSTTSLEKSHNYKQATQSYKRVTQTTAKTDMLSSLKNQIDNLAIEISQKEKRIKEIVEILQPMKPLLDDIEQIDKRYKNAEYIPDEIVQRYNKEVEEYNSLLNRYTPEMQELKALVADYDSQVNRYNNLIAEYNKKIQGG